MATLVQELRQQLNARETERKAWAAAINSRGTDQPPTPDELVDLDARLNAEADLKSAIERASKFEEMGVSPSLAQMQGDEHPAKRSGTAGARPHPLSLGAAFTASEQFVAALKASAPNGRLSDKSKFPMDAFSFAGLSILGGMNAALLTGDSDTSAGAFVITDRQSEIVTLGRRPLRIRDLIQNLQTTSDLVDYVLMASRTNNAAIVAEATAASGSSGVKPESAFTFDQEQAPVKTIANWIPVTRQAVADVPQLRGIIDTELTDNLEETLETEIVTGTSFPGILQTSGRQSQAWDTNILTTLRKAKTKVFTVGRRVPTGYALNPQEMEIIDLLQDNEARYYYGGPIGTMIPRAWGLPIAETEAVPAGTGIVGAWQYATLWDRMAAQILVSDSHSDFFVRNLLAILAELRAAFAVRQPSAFVEIDLTA